MNSNSLSSLSPFSSFSSTVSTNNKLGGPFDISLPGIDIRKISSLEERKQFILKCLTNDPIQINKYSQTDEFSELLETFLIPFEQDYFSFSLTQIPRQTDEIRKKVKNRLPSSPSASYSGTQIKDLCVLFGFEKLFYLISVSNQIWNYSMNVDDADFNVDLRRYLGTSFSWSNYAHLEVLGIVNRDFIAPNPYYFFKMFYECNPYLYFVGLAAAIRGDNIELLQKLLYDMNSVVVWNYIVTYIQILEQNDGKILIQETREYVSSPNDDFEDLLNSKNIMRWSLRFKCGYDDVPLCCPIYVKSNKMAEFLLKLSYSK